MGQELELPDWAKTSKMAGAFAGLNPEEDSLSEGIGQSYGIIGYKGKVWSIRANGERHNIMRDDGTVSSHLDVVILGQAKNKSKSYYPRAKGYEDGGHERPTCASMNGIVPDTDVLQKQSDNCALCPRNEWKTDPATGKRGRECTDYKRLAVLVLPPQTEKLFGRPWMEPVFLRVPPDSLKSIAKMDDTMGPQGHHYSSYVTRITFDPDKPHPCMVFRAFQPLSDKEAPAILRLRQDAMVKRITGGDNTATAITQKAVSQEEKVLQPSAFTSITLDALPATPSTTNGNGVEYTAVGVGDGGATLVAPLLTLDGGNPEESDAELDARIVKLIGG